MVNKVLVFNPSFLEILEKDASKVTGFDLKVSSNFKSADSFSYLLESGPEKFVGKIYRFEHRPPEGKLQIVERLLNDSNIPHEESVFTSYNHLVFKFGWSISKYISGGSARSFSEKGKLDYNEYFVKVGGLLNKIHQIKLDHFGSVYNEKRKFDTFHEYAQMEIEEQDYESLAEEFPKDFQILDKAKKWVLSNLSNFEWHQAVLVHDDANESNVLWNYGNPILIDWTDSLASVPTRDFTTLTFRRNDSVLPLLEKGYEEVINKDELKFYQVMRFIRLGRFYYLEDKNLDELRLMMTRLEVLLSRNMPYGA